MIMTKQEKNNEVKKFFYNFLEEKGFVAHDEGHGYWYVHPKNNGFASCMFQVTRKWDVDTFDCQSQYVLEFADMLETRLNEYIRMFDL